MSPDGETGEPAYVISEKVVDSKLIPILKVVATIINILFSVLQYCYFIYNLSYFFSVTCKIQRIINVLFSVLLNVLDFELVM